MSSPRAISSATISFGLVSIPIKVFTAASSQSVGFNMVHPQCGNRVRQKMWCPHCEEEVKRSETEKGYEVAKGQFVRFEPEELKRLDTPKSNTLDILEFVPLDTVDLIHVEKSYYLGPAKGGQKAYKLLSASMDRTGKVAVGRYWTRGKEQLVLLRPYKEGLLMHQLYYADEVRAFEDVDVGDEVKLRPGEPELADQLIEQLSSKQFRADKYRDEYRDRVVKAIEEKAAGLEIAAMPDAPAAQIVDLFEALKASLDSGSGPDQGNALDEDGKPKAKSLKKAEASDEPEKKATGS